LEWECDDSVGVCDSVGVGVCDSVGDSVGVGVGDSVGAGDSVGVGVDVEDRLKIDVCVGVGYLIGFERMTKEKMNELRKMKLEKRVRRMKW